LLFSPVVIPHYQLCHVADHNINSVRNSMCQLFTSKWSDHNINSVRNSVWSDHRPHYQLCHVWSDHILNFAMCGHTTSSTILGVVRPPNNNLQVVTPLVTPAVCGQTTKSTMPHVVRPQAQPKLNKRKQSTGATRWYQPGQDNT
jgi:hypothetical protein